MLNFHTNGITVFKLWSSSILNKCKHLKYSLSFSCVYCFINAIDSITFYKQWSKCTRIFRKLTTFFSVPIMALLTEFYLQVNLPLNCGRWKYMGAALRRIILIKKKVTLILFCFLFYTLYFQSCQSVIKKGFVDQPSCNKTDDTSTMQFWRFKLYQLGTWFF